jgi:rod shape-determining protein MreC
MFLPAQYSEGLAGAIRGTVLRPVLALQEGGTATEAWRGDVARLRAERDSLAAVLVGTATLDAENRQLRQMLGIQERLPLAFHPAEVIRVPERAFDGAFILTVGRARGVSEGDPIVSAAGLVGMVRNVDEHRSIGIDWTHRDFRASAMTADGQTYGIVEPRLSRAGERMLALTGVAYHAEVDSGTVVVTSGLGGVYPRGIPIGTVVGLEETEGAWRRSYLVRPMVGPGEMAHVLVLGDPVDDAPTETLAAAWGIRPEEDAPEEERREARRLIEEAAAPVTQPPAADAPPGAEPTPDPAAPAPDAGPPLLGVPVEPPPDGDAL